MRVNFYDRSRGEYGEHHTGKRAQRSDSERRSYMARSDEESQDSKVLLCLVDYDCV
jgi:hypothetical protein